MASVMTTWSSSVPCLNSARLASSMAVKGWTAVTTVRNVCAEEVWKVRTVRGSAWDVSAMATDVWERAMGERTVYSPLRREIYLGEESRVCLYSSSDLRPTFPIRQVRTRRLETLPGHSIDSRPASTILMDLDISP